jgi:Domain of unknown function (DUF3806)
MSSPFLRTPDEESFPKAEWPPIQDLDSIDIVVKRKDGGLDLAIVATQPIDDSPETLESIRHKVYAYLTEIDQEEFQVEMGHPPRDKTVITIVCDCPIHPKALTVIAQCRVTTKVHGVRLELRKSFGSAPIPLPEGGTEMRQSVRQTTQADRDQIFDQSAAALTMLRFRYGDVKLRQNEDDLRLLQQLHDDGGLQDGKDVELEAVGIAFGEILAARAPFQWITVEWQGERLRALQYRESGVFVYPGSMIAKRVNRAETVNFRSLYFSTLALVEQMNNDRETMTL